MPKLTRYCLGFFINGNLYGVVTLGWGTQPLQTIRKVLPYHDVKSRDYLEIGKMCFAPSMNHTGYFGSRVLSMVVKWMKKNTDCLFLYTLADGIMGKCGYVYQAANFRYLGNFMTSVYRCTATGEKIHPRSARKLLEENAEFDGVKKRNWLTHEFCQYKGIEKINGRMFRYIYPLSKNAGKMLCSYKEYELLSYPKDKDLFFSVRVRRGIYEQIPKPQFDRDVCQFNLQEY